MKSTIHSQNSTYAGRHISHIRRLIAGGVFAGAVAGATLLPGMALAGDGDGLLVQRFYETRQIDCARRWQAHFSNPNISMFGCVGFDQGMPAAAQAALAGQGVPAGRPAIAVDARQARLVSLPRKKLYRR